jgi:pimeloyl-ACP methyl ester carboxylesterase
MRAFELTAEKKHFFYEGLAGHPYPAQVVWGERDRMIGPEQRQAVMEALGVEDATLVPAKHFLQEDHPVEVAEAVASIAAS